MRASPSQNVGSSWSRWNVVLSAEYRERTSYPYGREAGSREAAESPVYRGEEAEVAAVVEVL